MFNGVLNIFLEEVRLFSYLKSKKLNKKIFKKERKIKLNPFYIFLDALFPCELPNMAKIQLCILRWVGPWAVKTWKFPALGQHQAAFENNSLLLWLFNHSHFAQLTSISVINWYFPSRQHLLQAGVSNHQQCQLSLHLGSTDRDFLSPPSCFVAPVLKLRVFSVVAPGWSQWFHWTCTEL